MHSFAMTWVTPKKKVQKKNLQKVSLLFIQQDNLLDILIKTFGVIS